MKKIITIMILGTILLVSCAKENDIKSAPSINWSTENIDKYLGTDIYCTYESIAHFM